MVSFYELVTSPQQTNVENEEREFDKEITTAQMTFTEYLHNDSVNKYKTEFESNVNQYNEYTRIIQEVSLQLRTPEIEDQQLVCTELATKIWSSISQNYITILTPIQAVITCLNGALQILVDNILGEWKRGQILFAYCEGGERTEKMKNDLVNLKSALDNIQTLFETLFELVWKMYRLLSEIRDCHARKKCTHPLEADVINDITLMLQKLILSSFVIVEQPPQIMHIKVAFEVSLRVLLAKFITKMDNIMVWFLSESQVKLQYQHNKQQQSQKQRLTLLNEKLYDISYTKCHFPLPCDNLQGKFMDMKLDKIVRSVKYDKVTEKFALQFRYTLDIENQPFEFDIWTTSLPVTATTNVLQDHIGWATITWDNSFFEIDRNPFDVPEYVPWSHMKWALTTRFYYQTGRHLNTKVFDRYLFDPSGSGSDRLISWAQFGKDKQFTTVFYEATKLTRLYLSKEWKNGLIEGFISKEQAWEKLRYCAPGTFLLRFSDNTPGGISVASIQMNYRGERMAHHMDPYIPKDFEKSPKPYTIGDLIRNLGEYTHLYPCTAKHEAFYDYYVHHEPLPNPYKEKKRSF